MPAASPPAASPPAALPPLLGTSSVSLAALGHRGVLSEWVQRNTGTALHDPPWPQTLRLHGSLPLRDAFLGAATGSSKQLQAARFSKAVSRLCRVPAPGAKGGSMGIQPPRPFRAAAVLARLLVPVSAEVLSLEGPSSVHTSRRRRACESRARWGAGVPSSRRPPAECRFCKAALLRGEARCKDGTASAQHGQGRSNAYAILRPSQQQRFRRPLGHRACWVHAILQACNIAARLSKRCQAGRVTGESQLLFQAKLM